MSTTITILTPAQIEYLDGAEYGLGPWDLADATDPDTLAAIKADIDLVIGYGHREDTTWITTGLIATYITRYGRHTSTSTTAPASTRGDHS